MYLFLFVWRYGEWVRRRNAWVDGWVGKGNYVLGQLFVELELVGVHAQAGHAAAAGGGVAWGEVAYPIVVFWGGRGEWVGVGG